jgi:hypothetical protein
MFMEDSKYLPLLIILLFPLGWVVFEDCYLLFTAKAGDLLTLRMLLLNPISLFITIGLLFVMFWIIFSIVLGQITDWTYKLIN